MKVVARTDVAQFSGMWGLHNSLQALAFFSSTADGEAMSSAATVETFSIMSTHGRAPKCSARSFAEMCAETRPQELNWGKKR